MVPLAAAVLTVAGAPPSGRTLKVHLRHRSSPVRTFIVF